jgi:hypothetical protein
VGVTIDFSPASLGCVGDEGKVSLSRPSVAWNLLFAYDVADLYGDGLAYRLQPKAKRMTSKIVGGCY